MRKFLTMSQKFWWCTKKITPLSIETHWKILFLISKNYRLIQIPNLINIRVVHLSGAYCLAMHEIRSEKSTYEFCRKLHRFRWFYSLFFRGSWINVINYFVFQTLQIYLHWLFISVNQFLMFFCFITIKIFLLINLLQQYYYL